MKLKYKIRRRLRINSRFVWMKSLDFDWWYNEDLNKWEFKPDKRKGYHRQHQDCQTMKAFRRKLKKAPKGVKFILATRWVGYDIEGTGTCDYQK